MSASQAQPSEVKDTSQTPEVTVSERRTRSGRVVKKPERYTPQEVCDDDYASDEYDSHESESVSSEISYDSEDISSESDADDEGNLDGFVVKTSSESESSDENELRSETDVSSDDESGGNDRRLPVAPRGRGRGRPAKRALVL